MPFCKHMYRCRISVFKVHLYFTLSHHAQQFSKVIAQFYPSSAMYEFSSFSMSLHNLDISVFLIFHQLQWVYIVSHCEFNLPFLKDRRSWYSFNIFISHFIYLILKFGCLFSYWIWILYPLSVICTVNIFSKYKACL